MEAGSFVRVFQQLRPCAAPGVHKFIVSYPPAGQFGYSQVICERCGMTPKEARS